MLAVKTLTDKPNIFRRTTRLMGSSFEITVAGDSPVWASARIDDAIAEINRVEKLLSAFTDDSAINDINRNAGIKAVKTNPEIFRLISRSLNIAELTHGAFDIIYYAGDKDAAAGKSALKTEVSYKNVELDAKTQTVFLKEKGMRIGFGANSKGYAADRAKYILQMQGVSSGVINADGDLLAWGLQPDNQPWTVAAADPEQNAKPFANVEISNMAISTSVNTERYTAIRQMAEKQANAINTKKGFPVSEIKSVSIISACAELAGAMATPLMSIGINTGLYLINQLNQLACVIVDDHNRVYTSKDVCISN